MRCSCVLVVLGCVAFLGATETPAEVEARAIRQMEARDFKSASLTLRLCLKTSPREPGLWNLLGVSESELSQDAAAREAFEQGLSLAPDSIALNENIGFLNYRQGQYAAAKRYLTRAASLGSDNPGAAFSLAASQIRTGEEPEGLALLIRLQSQLENQGAYWTERGWVELRRNPSAAESSFARALDLAPEDVRALNGAASDAEARHQDEQALSFLIRAKKAAPDDLRTLLHFATVCLRRDLAVDALDAVVRARKLAPSNDLALFLHARVEIAFQQWQESHDLFSEFDKKAPNYAQAQYALGWLDIKLNRPAEARQHLERSLLLEPGNVDARYELAHLDLEEGHSEAAERKLRQVLSKAPRHAKAMVALGDVMTKRGNPRDAKAFYEQAIEADPNSGPAHYKLSTVLTRLHDNERAAAERTLGASLNAEALKAGKTVLVLAEPDGRLLTGDPAAIKGNE